MESKDGSLFLRMVMALAAGAMAHGEAVETRYQASSGGEMKCKAAISACGCEDWLVFVSSPRWTAFGSDEGKIA